MGRPAHIPDPTSRRQVEAMAGYGVPEADIAGVIGLSPKTLRKHYRDELKHGHVKANAKVAENLFRKATGEGRESVIAAIFWLKTRAGWKETSVQELSASGDGVLRIERIIVQPPVREEAFDPARTLGERLSETRTSAMTEHSQLHPTTAERKQVEALAGFGVSEADIAIVLAMNPAVLRQLYPAELAAAAIKANAKVAESLYRRATGEGREAVIAAIFWLKARANWRETSSLEVEGKGGQPIRISSVRWTPACDYRGADQVRDLGNGFDF